MVIQKRMVSKYQCPGCVLFIVVGYLLDAESKITKPMMKNLELCYGGFFWYSFWNYYRIWTASKIWFFVVQWQSQ